MELPYDVYHTYEELTSICEAMAAANPDTCRLSTLGQSREGREIWMLTLTDLTTAQQPEDKPAYLVYGNIHAIEACGVHCALHNAQTLLQDERELLERIVVYVVPRLAVDGAEFFVNTGSRVRSRLWDGASTQDYDTQPYDAARGAPDGVMLPNTLCETESVLDLPCTVCR